MSGWDEEIFTDEVVIDFLEEISALDDGEQEGALLDACQLALNSSSDDDQRAGLGAATVAAIWSGAPYTAAAAVEDYPFIRKGIGQIGDELRESAAEVFAELADGIGENEESAAEFAEAVE